jgi:hypothetical protein
MAGWKPMKTKLVVNWCGTSDHPDFTQGLPRKLLPTRAKEAQRLLREKR